MDLATTQFLERVRALVPGMRARAAELDVQAGYPSEDLAALLSAGAASAPLPQAMGGLGLGTEPSQADGILAMLRLLGSGNLSVGRLFEAHINAIRLVVRFGSENLRQEAAQDCRAGELLGLWVTDPPGDGLRIGRDSELSGRKQFCSGAAFARRAVVTGVDGAGETRLVYARLDRGAIAKPLPGGLAGMRAAGTGQVLFDAVPGVMFGQAGDYLREPDFSCGAWRTSAVTLGALEALGQELRTQLVARGRAGDPHQQARVGQVLIATETARLWMVQAARRGEAAGEHDQDAVAYVGLARLAVERACLDVIELVQRSLGVSAFLRSNVVERFCRDLETYLRQPAADMVLTEAAALAMLP